MSAVNGVPPEQLNPYIYFNREVNAYKRLNTEMEGHFPKARLTISITAEHEDRLFASHMRSYQPARYRRKVRKSQEELPLKALLLDYVEGVRLTSEALLADTALQAELLTAMNTLHQRGVLWGDVKWRNIIVTTRLTPRQSAELFDRQTNTQETVDGQGSLVLLDFSNACFGPLDESREPQINMDSSFLSIEEWEGRRKQELRIVQNMIDHGRLSGRQDP